MLHRTERTFENIPVGPLGFIPVNGCQDLGKKVDDYLVKWRKEAKEKVPLPLFLKTMQKILSSLMQRFLVLVPERQKELSMNLSEEKIFTLWLMYVTTALPTLSQDM